VVEHLYVHIPFCPKICPYCSFYKEASDRNNTQAFLDAVLTEAGICATRLRPRTVFFGGGTPTALSTKQLDYLLAGLHRQFDFDFVEEWTIEMNPATVSLEKARLLRDHGVNRVSMGVQSWDAELLDRLGRVHTADQALRSFETLRSAGFDNINLDHIFGIPGQSLDQWTATLEQTVRLQPEHVSAYCLTYEEDTEYFRRYASGEFHDDEERDAHLFETSMQLLATHGYHQYEISNYAKPGRDCLHNIAYWEGRDYVGLGPSAFSTVGDRRWQNVPDTAEYISGMETASPSISFEERLSPALRKAESLAFSLRTDRGIPRDGFPEEMAAKYLELNLIAPDGDRWILTRQGKMLADTLAEELV